MKRKNTTSKRMKQYISESLLILLEKKSYTDITICEISNKAGVNRSTYYRHFNSKEEIVEFYYSTILKNYVQTIPEEIQLYDYLLNMFKYYLKHKKQLILLHKSKLSYLLLNSLNIDFHQQTSFKSFEEKCQVYYHTGGIFNFLLLWFENDMNISPQDLAKAAVSLLPSNTKPIFTKTVLS